MVAVHPAFATTMTEDTAVIRVPLEQYVRMCGDNLNAAGRNMNLHASSIQRRMPENLKDGVAYVDLDEASAPVRMVLEKTLWEKTGENDDNRNSREGTD